MGRCKEVDDKEYNAIKAAGRKMAAGEKLEYDDLKALGADKVPPLLAAEEKPWCPLTEALRLTTGPRQEAYGHPKVNFANIAEGWNVILKNEGDKRITPEQVALCMIWTKVCREINQPAFDNEVDIAGYVNTLHMIKERHQFYSACAETTMDYLKEPMP